ncbi:hypothetical protein L1887_23083 [Cichorium endivia]|nr:hypothetical protein L1887_23083 [Cichorium endivia]
MTTDNRAPMLVRLKSPFKVDGGDDDERMEETRQFNIVACENRVLEAVFGTEGEGDNVGHDGDIGSSQFVTSTRDFIDIVTVQIEEQHWNQQNHQRY